MIAYHILLLPLAALAVGIFKLAAFYGIKLINVVFGHEWLMGEKLSPEQPSTSVNLPQAKEIVDILSILETKTQGNLTAEEAAVMKDMLYTLRMKYVEASSGAPPAA